MFKMFWQQIQYQAGKKLKRGCFGFGWGGFQINLLDYGLFRTMYYNILNFDGIYLVNGPLQESRIST